MWLTQLYNLTIQQAKQYTLLYIGVRNTVRYNMNIIVMRYMYVRYNIAIT